MQGWKQIQMSQKLEGFFLKNGTYFLTYPSLCMYHQEITGTHYIYHNQDILDETQIYSPFTSDTKLSYKTV